MFNIQDVANGSEVAYNKVKDELGFILNERMYGVSSAIHDAITQLWLLPETPEREALRKRLYELSDEFHEILSDEYQNYKNKENF